MKTILDPVCQINVEEGVQNLEDIEQDVMFMLTKSADLFKLSRYGCFRSIDVLRTFNN